MTCPIYRQEVIDRAREHAEAGWPDVQIRTLLKQEFGHAPCVITIKGWCNPEYAKKRARETRAAKRRHVARNGGPRRDISPELRQERMERLRNAGLSFSGIAIVSEVLWGTPLSPEQVRYRLRAAA